MGSSNNRELVTYLRQKGESIAKVAAANIDQDKLIFAIGRIAMANPKIVSCDWKSIVKAAMDCAELGLYPSDRGPYVIPYANECKLDLGAAGWLAVCHRSGMFSKISARVVREGETFHVRHEERPPFIHHIGMENMSSAGEINGAYVHFVFANGEQDIHVCPKKRLDEIRGKSKGQAWSTDYQGMAIAKTIKEACKKIAKGLGSENLIVKALDKDVDDFNVDDPFVGDALFESKEAAMEALVDDQVLDLEVERGNAN